MNRQVLFIIGIFITTSVFAQTNSKIAIIPEPVKIEQKTGYFTLPQNIIIQTVETTDLKQTLVDLQQRLSAPTGYKVSVSANAPAAVIKLELNKTEDARLGNE